LVLIGEEVRETRPQLIDLQYGELIVASSMRVVQTEKRWD
jgi:hypothetical protein